MFLRCIDPFVSGVYAGNPETLSMKAALGKIARIEDYAYSIGWNKFGAIFYGGLKRQVELTKEQKLDPPDPRWPGFERGNPGSFRFGLGTLPNAIAAELGCDNQPTDKEKNDKSDSNHQLQQREQPLNRPDSKVRLGWTLVKLEKKVDAVNSSDGDGGGFLATFSTDDKGSEVVVEAKTVVSTAPAHALRHALEPVLPDGK